jgi:hypothetical protein
MKKLLLIATCVFAAVATYGQGTVTFANNSATAITNATVGGPGGRATVTVGLYGSTTLGLGQSDGVLALVGAAGNTLAPGLFSLGTRGLGNAGDTVTLQVRAWSGGFANYAAALAAAQTDGTILIGKSTVWEQITGGGTNPSQPITGAGRLQAFTVSTVGPVVPEPSSIALGLLGLGAIVLFRRRK